MRDVLNARFKGPMKPNRFVFHVSYKKYRKSIFCEGLKVYGGENYPPAIFANQGMPNIEWYPLCLDLWDFSFGGDAEIINGNSEDDLMYFFMNYDFWRIDTHALPHDWYYDQATDLKGFYAVACFENIPVGALKLFNFFPDHIVSSKGNGAYHIKMLSNFRANNNHKVKTAA